MRLCNWTSIWVASAISVAYAIGGSIDDTNNHWGRGGNVASPVHVSESVGIPNGQKLTIEPGTEILCDADTYIGMGYGPIVANGTSDSIIVFRSSSSTPSAGDWLGLYGQDCRLSFVRIEHAERAVRVRARPCTLSQCVITSFTHCGICLSDSAKGLVASCTIVPVDRSGTAIDIVDASVTVNNTVLGSPTSGHYYAVYAVGDLGSELRYSLLLGTVPVDGITSITGCLMGLDPIFRDEANGDFHLEPTSPGIDAGDPAADYSLEPACDGQNTRINMGAYGNTPEATCKQNSAVQPSARQRVAAGRGTTAAAVYYSLDGRAVRYPHRVPTAMPTGIYILEVAPRHKAKSSRMVVLP